MLLYKKIIFVAILLAFPTLAIAQVSVYSPMPVHYDNITFANIYQQGFNSTLKEGDTNNRNDATAQRVQVDPKFTSSRARTNKNLQSFADKTRASDPAQADKMEALFASTDIMGLMGDAMRGVGLSRNNTADAFAVYWVGAWQAANGRTDTPSTETFKSVAAQAARGLSQSPEFAAANDAQKQEMAEALMLQAAMIDGHMEEAAGNTSQLKAIATAVKQGASASGLELDTMTLTEEGFREGSPRKRSDASDTGENEKALAANDTGTDGDGSTNYALIAAAAGAGLGGVFLLGKAMGRKG